jgi:hypothetical protein
MDHPIHPPAAQFRLDILYSIEDGIGVGVVRVLLGQRVARAGHGELPLDLVEDDPGAALLHEAVQVPSEDRRDAPVGIGDDRY